VALRPRIATFYANLAEAHRGLKEYDKAIDCCRTALRLRPNYAEAANNLGLALQGLEQHEEAAEAFRSALAMKPDFALVQNNLGTLLRDMGRRDEASEAFRTAVEIDPKLGEARANYGQILVDQGKPEEALPHCEEGVRLAPNLAAAHNNLGNTYRALERWSQAHLAYAAAAQLAPDNVRIHVNRGLAFQGDGKFADAIASFRKAVELTPEDPDIWRYLADAHAADDDYAAAIPWYERLIALRPELPHAHSDLGWALQEEGRLTEAAACYRQALELQPNFVPALLNQGNLHEEIGEMAEAEACHRRAHEINPNGPVPLARLATLLRGKLPEEDREAIRARLADPELEDMPRGNLLFGLAHVCDASGDYAEAARCLEQANALALSERRGQGRRYDPAEHVRYVDRVIEGFTPELFARLAGTGDDTRQPVFVCGMPRSGTTLVEQVLASHSRVHGAGERRLARQTLDAIPAVLGRDEGIFPCLKALDAAAVKQLAQKHMEGLRAIQEHDHPQFVPDRIVDKMPDNYLHLGLLAIVFPRATLIHVRRDPRDIAFSCWMTNFRSIRWANDPDHLAGRLWQHQRVMEYWRSVLPVTLHEVAYEELVDNFEVEARRLVAACGLGWEPSCLQFHETARPVRTASVTQVRQPLYRRSLARWRHYEGIMDDFFARLPVPEEPEKQLRGQDRNQDHGGIGSFTQSGSGERASDTSTELGGAGHGNRTDSERAEIVARGAEVFF
jgi:tetratricopeptide (TPR) repeat protein